MPTEIFPRNSGVETSAEKKYDGSDKNNYHAYDQYCEFLLRWCTWDDLAFLRPRTSEMSTRVTRVVSFFNLRRSISISWTV